MEPLMDLEQWSIDTNTDCMTKDFNPVNDIKVLVFPSFSVQFFLMGFECLNC